MPRRKLSNEIPYNYAACLHADCPRAKTCLRQIAYGRMLEGRTHLKLVNPRKCSQDGQCEFYREGKSLRFARGFANFKKRMYPDQYERFSTLLQCHFGRSQYYERRKGDIPLTSGEQELILDVLKQVGVSEELQFDQYEEAMDWSE